jgi:RND family efflux transporter MFP subunit
VSATSDLSRLRIDRNQAPRRRWLVWLLLVVLAALAAAGYPAARDYYDERRAPEVEVIRAAQVAATLPGAPAALPVLVATGYVVARRSSDVGVKIGGRLQTLAFEEGTRVRRGQVIATIEHADLDAQLASARASVAEAETQLVQAAAAHEEDVRHLERQRALARDGIATTAALTAADAAAAVSAARIKTAEAAIVSARARVAVNEEALENSNVRAPFSGVVVKKRAEVGETVSPFGVAGQSAREGGAIATIADLGELEVQAEVSETSVAKLRRDMTASVTLQAYPDARYRGRIREIFPSADRAKAIIEVRVSIVDADPKVKPDMTASVTFEESAAAPAASSGEARAAGSSGPKVLVPKRALAQRNGQPSVWVVTGRVATLRPVTLGPDRLDHVEVASGVAPGEALIVNAPSGLADGGRVRVKTGA